MNRKSACLRIAPSVRVLAAALAILAQGLVPGMAAFAQTPQPAAPQTLQAANGPRPPEQPAASDLPVVSSSSIAGLRFEDRPYLLPEEGRFRHALDTVSDKLGRVCLMPEAYGWPLRADEQPRADRIFASAIGDLRDMGYRIVPQDIEAIAPGLTGFSAESSGRDERSGYGRDILALWSGGKSGLILLLCETQPKMPPNEQPVPDGGERPMESAEATMPGADAAGATAGYHPQPLKTIAGTWTGGYSCLDRGKFDASLVLHLEAGNKLRGTFSVSAAHATARAKSSSYEIGGEYDPASQRAMIVPQGWIRRRLNAPHVPMIATFYLDQRQISGIFQGVNGCTSFEGAMKSEEIKAARKKTHKAKKARRKISTTHARQAPAAQVIPAPVAPPASAPATNTTQQSSRPQDTAPVAEH